MNASFLRTFCASVVSVWFLGLPSVKAAPVFEKNNLAAWCIVPFDAKKRGPEERAAMLKALGIRQFVYDYRTEHVPQWEAEMEALKKNGIELTGWWFPRTLNEEGRRILEVIGRHGWKRCDLWVTGGDSTVEKEVERLKPMAVEAAKVGVRVGLYNHGGWFGEPDNQIATIEALKKEGVNNVGIVYNLHHGHGHLTKLPELMALMKPYLIGLNLNGMDVDGDKKGRKILPIGVGTEDVKVLKVIRDSGYAGPVGILNHTNEDAEGRLKDNLAGLQWVVAQLDGAEAGPRPKYVTWHEEPKLKPASSASEFTPERKPLRVEEWPDWEAPVNRDRMFDFYGKQARFFMKQKPRPSMVEVYPGLDGGKMGHWGNQTEETWRDDRWSKSDLGNVLSTVIHAEGFTLPKAVALRLGNGGEMAAVFDPLTLSFPLVWREGFLKVSDVRRGFMGGMSLEGKVVQKERIAAPKGKVEYRGFYRDGKRVVFAYALNGEELLDTVWEENGVFLRERGPVEGHSHKSVLKGGVTQWPGWIEMKGEIGENRPFAVDTIPVPFENPYGTLFFISGHDFFQDGTAAVATMTGEVWLVKGIDEKLEKVRWKRFATGLHQPLGVRIVNDQLYVLGRDQITRLQDLNGDDEADFHECVTNAQLTSAGGHDYITGLEIDAEGRFYFASGNQGVCRVKPGGEVEVLAKGFRNPNGLGLSEDGTVTTSVQEGDWTPASAICQVVNGAHFGAGGPKDGKMPELPLIYFPRGEDNSSGGQCFVSGEKWSALRGRGNGSGNLVHFSPGSGSAFLVMREQLKGKWQGAAVRLGGGFKSGAQNGRFHPVDGHLYVSGLNGWSSYTPEDGCLQRVRYVGGVAVPVEIESRDNGVLIRFDEAVDVNVAKEAAKHGVQCWNYKYSAAYGSPEWSVKHPDKAGHDVLEVRSAHVLEGGKTLFLEIPQLVPANVVHLHVALTADRSADVFLTAHALGEAFVEFPGYQTIAKESAAVSPDPMASLKMPPPAKPNVWTKGEAGRKLVMEAALGLQFVQKELRVKAGERVTLEFNNPDVVPHNWVLLKPGTTASVGQKVNLLIADPQGLARHYIPETDEVLVFTDMVNPQEKFTIHFDAPKERGDYPYLCSFPGHWQAMNGVMKVE
ncbi:heme-binding domain-containing protein [Phragmitibacter flavus]|uniref:Heme-binding domain-containing protein n=1 Tax=Phragmitibacter flavus TaxID=2576071 RepID=A0A5R8KG89_9BACT|nr:plastocyanin/azurin family copper-binding protein [Phragmitibacter flavus]TLD71251.1 heme-binding domain-containing protein [Phragmitibacter flavus]